MVDKEVFNAFEKTMEKRIVWINWVIFTYNLTKIIVLSLCMTFEHEVEGLMEKFLMGCDITVEIALATYFFYTIGFLLRMTYTRQRYEFRKHCCFLITVAVAMLICFPMNLF